MSITIAFLLLLALLSCQVHGIIEEEEFRLTPANWLRTILTDGGVASDSPPPTPQPIRVIGAGLPRTGTASFRTAMGVLGLKCYHMVDGCMETPGHQRMWYQYHVKKTIPIDDVLEAISVEGFNATVDGPTAFLYQEQMRKYPDAKVVLTVRDSPEQWADSFAKTITRGCKAVHESFPFYWIGPFARTGAFIDSMFVKGKLPYKDPSLLPDFYREFVEEVKRTVPPEQLLVFNAKDGWEPLCEFLAPVAASIRDRCEQLQTLGQPYPHVNDSANIILTVIFVEMLSLFCKTVPFLLVAIGLFYKKRGRDTSKAKATANGNRHKTE